MLVEEDQIWMVVVGFIIAFILAFGIGANDVANSFGTSVGAKVLTLRQACILASIFETLGAILLGAKVSDTIRKGIIDVEPYKNDTELLMVGNVAALSGSCVWLISATILRLPVSATHSIVGATVGFALVAHGTKGINWVKFGTIIGSWFVSPVMAGVISVAIFYLVNKLVLTAKNPLESGLRFLPFCYAFTLIINLFTVFCDGPPMLYFDRIPLWGAVILSVGSGVICAVVVWLAVVPWLKRRIQDKLSSVSDTGSDYVPISGSITPNSSTDSDKPLALETEVDVQKKSLNGFTSTEVPPVTTQIKRQNTEDSPLMDHEFALGDSTPVKSTTMVSLKAAMADSKQLSDVPFDAEKQEELDNAVTALEKSRRSIKDLPETGYLFSFLQVLTAVFGSFAHGGNDVSNAIGPLVSLWLIATMGEVFEKAATPVWILLYGGVGISVGLCVLGRRVIKTVGEDLTKVTPSSGFCIEIGSALTVLIASKVGIPISTTHCKVGSIVFVGFFRSRQNVDWSVFRNITLAWLITLPVCGGVSAAIMAGLSRLV